MTAAPITDAEFADVMRLSEAAPEYHPNTHSACQCRACRFYRAARNALPRIAAGREADKARIAELEARQEDFISQEEFERLVGERNSYERQRDTLRAEAATLKIGHNKVLTNSQMQEVRKAHDLLRAALQIAPEAAATKEYPDECHASHDVRSSDASTFDVICKKCGAHDDVPGGWGGLRFPCSAATKENGNG